MNSRIRRRASKGTSLIEACFGAIFMIPIMLLAVDLAAITLANQINDHLAKDAARAAASMDDKNRAESAAQKTLNNFVKSALVTSVKLDGFNYDSSNSGQVTVTTKIEINMPAPFPGMGARQFVARSVEPIVGTPAPI